MFKFTEKCLMFILLLSTFQQSLLANATDGTTELPEHETKTMAINLIDSTTNSHTTQLSKNEFPITYKPYCQPDLCEFFNGTHITHATHIACQNDGSFGPMCGSSPHLLVMSARRRNLILDMHNLARSKIASGQLEGYKPASHMPILKWDNELEYLATLHAKRCDFDHDKCRNTHRFPYSGQNIGYFWIGREFKSHSKRMKSFVLNWFREYRDANQSFIDNYYPHPENKKIGHFTLLVADRVHRVGCAAVRFRDPQQIEDMRFIMTCNYDFNNIIEEPIYQSGPTATKCSHTISEKFPYLCDWKNPVYDYEIEEILKKEDDNLLDNKILVL